MNESPRTDQIDHDLYKLDPNLPRRNVVQDLYSTDKTQEMSWIMQIIRLPPGNMS